MDSVWIAYSLTRLVHVHMPVMLVTNVHPHVLKANTAHRGVTFISPADGKFNQCRFQLGY